MPCHKPNISTFATQISLLCVYDFFAGRKSHDDKKFNGPHINYDLRDRAVYRDVREYDRLRPLDDGDRIDGYPIEDIQNHKGRSSYVDDRLDGYAYSDVKPYDGRRTSYVDDRLGGYDYKDVLDYDTRRVSYDDGYIGPRNTRLRRDYVDDIPHRVGHRGARRSYYLDDDYVQPYSRGSVYSGQIQPGNYERRRLIQFGDRTPRRAISSYRELDYNGDQYYNDLYRESSRGLPAGYSRTEYYNGPSSYYTDRYVDYNKHLGTSIQCGQV